MSTEQHPSGTDRPAGHPTGHPAGRATGRATGPNRRGFLGLGAAAGGAVLLGGLGTRTAGAAPAAVPAAGPAAAAPAVAPAAAPVAAPAAATPARTSAVSLGVNATGYDSGLQDAAVPPLLKAAAIGRVRYPGGGNADETNWEDPTLGTPWPRFMQLMAEIDAAPMLTVNYGQLDLGPDAAAAWVADALTFDSYDPATAIWVLGNEGYGPWEHDDHPDPHTPASYAANVRPYFERMQAVDPRTRVGFPMSIDRTVAGGTGTWVADPDAWNRTVLHANADLLDFVDFHWYPVFGIPVLTNAEIFATLGRIPGALHYLRGVIDAEKPGLPIVVSESNISQSEIVYNVQPVAALYAVTTALRWLALGADSYMWWQVHNYDNMNGDFGFLSNGTGDGGPSATALTTAAAAGARFLAVKDASKFHYGHQFTIGSGSAQESRKITAVPGGTTLAAAVAAGATNLPVAATESLTTAGATTDHRPYFAPGTVVTVGDGGQAEQRVVTAVGTPAGTATLAAPAAAGDTVLKVVGVGMGGQSIPVFLPGGLAVGGRVQVGSGASAETATIAALGTSSSLGTTLAAPAHAGDTVVHVVSVADTNVGIALYVGDAVTVDTGGAQEVRRITAVGSGAAAPTALATAVAAGDRRVRLVSTAGVTVGHPLLLGDGSRAEVTPPVVAVGAQTATTLVAAAAAGDTVVTVPSATGLLAGHPFVIDTGAGQEVRTIVSVGRPGAAGTGITLSSALGRAHAAGVAALDAGSGVVLSGPVRTARPAGSPARDLGSGVTLSAPLKRSHAAGAPARDTGRGITLTAPLARAHADGSTVTTPGTGVTLDRPLGRAHASGTSVHVDGLTVTPALSRAHGKGTPLAELGLKEPPMDTPLPAYWGFVLASKLTRPGATLVELDQPSATTFAFSSTQGSTRTVCLVNTDDAAPVTLTVDGLAGTGSLQVWEYGLTRPELVESTRPGSTLAAGVTLAPESVTVMTGSVRGTAAKATVVR